MIGALRARLASLAGLALLATLARAVGLPLSRHRFDGHEGDYLRAFQGELLEGSTRLYPLLAGLYAGLGALTQDSRALLGLSIAAGVLTVLAGALLVERRFGARAGLLVGLLLALSPTHVFWSASAYNVALPQALLVGACALGVQPHRVLRWVGIPLYALACGMRAELALLAPAVALLAGWRTALGALGLALAWPVLDTSPGLHSPLRVLPLNLRLLPFLGAAFPLAVIGARKRSLPWLAAAVYVHLLGSCFDDYGSRHALFGVLAASGALAEGLEGPRQWRSWLALPALVLSIAGCLLVHQRYYASAQDFAATLEAQPSPPACGEVLYDPLAPESHWNGLPPDPCWGEEHHHWAWTSRGLQDRALRMHLGYDLEPIGVLQRPGGPRQVYALR